MVKLLIKIIRWYQKLPLNSHFKCKYIPTCSNYAIIVLKEFGIFKGGFLTIKRLIKCNPLSHGGIDLPPKRRKNEEN